MTSSYFCGKQNEYAAYGYNRDGKKGKKQAIIGLLTDDEGFPVSVKVFKGNTSDQKTVIDQIKTIKDGFGCKNVTFVGDRGMIKSAQIDDLEEEDFHFITAITKAQIKSLIKKGNIDPELFDNNLCEIEIENYRYILRMNPIRCEEIRRTRNDKINSLKSFIEKKNTYLKEHQRAKIEVQKRNIKAYMKKLKLDSFIDIIENDRTLAMIIDDDKRMEVEKLDGCYVLKTDLKKEDSDMQTIHKRYKDLFLIEKAFKNIKTQMLEVRPIFVRKKKRTEGHVFLAMIAYMIYMYLQRSWKDFNITVEEGIHELSTVCVEEIIIDDVKINTIPQPRELPKALLEKLVIHLPKSIKARDFIWTQRLSFKM